MNWPDALITELAARRCIIFLGSGASASCLSQDGTRRPSTWGAFLDGLIAKMNGGDEVLVRGLMDKEKYLDAAEIIMNHVNSADFAAFIREELVQPRYQSSVIHESVLEIDPKVVLTTNYDMIYDNYCTSGAAVDGYNVCKYYEDHLVSDLRSPVRSIIKAHGCVSDPSKIVLSRSQYFEVRQQHNNFYKILDSLFLTNTILFVGYSLSDPDIQLTLENVNIAAKSAHPHYIAIGDDTNEELKNAFKKTYNLEFIEFPAGQYDELNKGLTELKESVKNLRVTNPI